MIPNNIMKEHIIKAINEIKNSYIPKGKGSKKYLIKHENDYYPPKYIISLANKYPNGEILDVSQFSGGRESNNFLKNLGFKIIEISSLSNKMLVKLKKQNIIMSIKIHTGENCSECKNVLLELLIQIYGEVKTNYKIDVGTIPDDFKNSAKYETLKNIYDKLKSYRGFTNFVKSRKLPPCDYFLPNQGKIIEFDESQHFTKLRELSLKDYPKDTNINYKKEKWIKLCEKINAKDNNPYYRDEQRAWYDTIRDFLPSLDILETKDIKSISRLYAKDFEWCSLNPNKSSDIFKFKEFLVKYKIEVRNDSNPTIARVINVGKWKGKINNSKEVFKEIYKKWPKNTRVKFIITCGGFIEFKAFETISKKNIVDVKNPSQLVLNQLLEKAENYVKKLLDDQIKTILVGITDYLTIGIDLYKEEDPTKRDKSPHIELVFLYDLKKDEFHWTGKSYPTQSQEYNLVRVSNLKTHFIQLEDIGEVLILGCHDLTIFNPRSKNAKRWRKQVNQRFKNIVLEKKPVYILHHPHGTAKKRSWLNAWKQIEKKFKNTMYVSSGRYFDSKRERAEYDTLEDVLKATRSKNISTIDFIVTEI